MIKQPEELVGRSVGPYVVDRLIGQGGFAWVFAARHGESGAQVALKVLKPRYSGDRQFESRFRNESQVAMELKHPNIVEIREVGQDGDFTFFVMDLYTDSLASLLKRNGPLPEQMLVRLFQDITGALAFAHAAGIVHRDLKTDNILLRDDGSAVLTDFGIARVVSGYTSATGVNMTIGTPHYVSPEQAQGRQLDGRSDLYALGVTLYKAATGDVPFRSTDWFELARMHVEDPPAAPTLRRPELSRRLEKVILRCLAKHPDDRYASAEALLADLQALYDPTRGTAAFGLQRPETASGLETSPRRPRWMLALVGIAIVGVVAMLVVMFGRR